MIESYVYLIILIGTFIFPFLFSFEGKVSYHKSWKYLFPSMIITASIFLLWDFVFTQKGVWGFNEMYNIGIYVFGAAAQGGLPIEEVLFFFIIPFSSIFIYLVLNHFYSHSLFFDRIQKQLSYAILIMAVLVLFFHYDKAYTALNCSYAILLLCLQLFFVKGNYMGKFYRFYLWHLIPFFIVNGILTGTGIYEEVVWYDPSENLNIKMGTIPIEDSLYSFSLMLMNISIFEYLKKKY